jgi:hypothetical protein
MIMIIIIKDRQNNSLLKESIALSVPTRTDVNNKSDILLTYMAL